MVGSHRNELFSDLRSMINRQCGEDLDVVQEGNGLSIIVVRSAVGGLTAVKGQTGSVCSGQIPHCVCRPPYQPKTAPIDYKICDIAYELQRKINQHDNTDNTIEQTNGI